MSGKALLPLIVLSLAVPCLRAEHLLTLQAFGDRRSLDTCRVVERVGDSYVDVTAEGMRIGLRENARRIAVVRPSFRHDVRPYKDWTVRSVSMSLGGSTLTTSSSMQ